MTKDDVKIAKKKILKCLTEDFTYGKNGGKTNQAIFDPKEGFACFNGTDLHMVMNAVVLGLFFAMGNDEDDIKSKEILS